MEAWWPRSSWTPHMTYIQGPHDTMLANRIFYQITPFTVHRFHGFAPKKEGQPAPGVDPFQVEIYPFPVIMANEHVWGYLNLNTCKHPVGDYSYLLLGRGHPKWQKKWEEMIQSHQRFHHENPRGSTLPNANPPPEIASLIKGLFGGSHVETWIPNCSNAVKRMAPLPATSRLFFQWQVWKQKCPNLIPFSKSQDCQVNSYHIFFEGVCFQTKYVNIW